VDTATLLSLCALCLLGASALAALARKQETLAFAAGWHRTLAVGCAVLALAGLITTDWLITPLAVALGAANWWSRV
jgi:hypothetical protein